MSYHLRRLRLHGLIERVPHTLRYEVTDFGLRAALFLTRAHRRVGRRRLGRRRRGRPAGAIRSELRRCLDALESEIDRLATRSRLAA